MLEYKAFQLCGESPSYCVASCRVTMEERNQLGWTRGLRGVVCADLWWSIVSRNNLCHRRNQRSSGMHAPCWSNQKQVILASKRGCFLVSIWWYAWAHPASSARDRTWFTSHANSERDLGQTVQLKDERTINSRNNISDKKRDHPHSHSYIKRISSEFSFCSVPRF